MWIAMTDAGIFSTPLVRMTVVAAIVSHYLLGGLLLAALVKGGQAKRATLAGVA